MSEPAHRALTRQAYDTVAESYAAALPGLAAEALLDAAMIDELVARCRADPPGPVADVGCGPGRVSAELSGRGLEVRGFDLSPRTVQVARRTHPHLRFEVAATEALPVADATFAGVLAWYSLIHTPPAELGVAVDEIARVLRPGGHLLTGFHAGGGERVDRASGYGHDVAFVSHRHDPDHVAALLDDGGLDVSVRLLRSAQGRERAPQAFVLATRRPWTALTRAGGADLAAALGAHRSHDRRPRARPPHDGRRRPHRSRRRSGTDGPHAPSPATSGQATASPPVATDVTTGGEPGPGPVR